MLLHHAFEQAARRLPDKTALVAGAHRLTYDQLHSQVHALARALQTHGVQPGDRVLVMLENSPQFAVAVHAVLAAGAVFVPVSAQAKTPRLVFLAHDTRATALLTERTLAPAWAPALCEAQALLSVLVALGPTGTDAREQAWPADDVSCAPVQVPREPDDLAALIYTSGSTGVPNGVMLSHRNMTSAWAAVQTYLQLQESDVIALALPPAFSYGLYNLLMGLGLGATVVLERQAAFPLKLAQTLERERVSVLPGVPTLWAALLGVADLPRLDLSALRLLTNAAAALPAAHLQRLRAALPQARLYSMYGLTECMRASYLEPGQLDVRPGSVGRGIPGQQHWLMDEHDNPLPHGSTGQLVVSGAHVMHGYWERPALTQQRLRRDPHSGQLRLYTGDLFRSDAEGYLYFVARMDDIIKTRGEKVAPREVEDAIYQLPGVTGCAVVGVPDDTLGQALHAHVTLAAGSALTERDIIRHCLGRLESYMAPKHVTITDALPRTDSGKIRHASLRA